MVSAQKATSGQAAPGGSVGLTLIRRVCEKGAKEGEQVEGPLEAGRMYRYEVIVSSALPTSTVMDVLVTNPQVRRTADWSLENFAHSE